MVAGQHSRLPQGLLIPSQVRGRTQSTRPTYNPYQAKALSPTITTHTAEQTLTMLNFITCTPREKKKKNNNNNTSYMVCSYVSAIEGEQRSKMRVKELKLSKDHRPRLGEGGPLRAAITGGSAIMGPAGKLYLVRKRSLIPY